MSSDSNEIGDGLESANKSAGNTTTWAARGYLFLVVLAVLSAVGLGIYTGRLPTDPIVQGWMQAAWVFEYLIASFILSIAGFTIIALILSPPDGFWPGFTSAFKRVIHNTSFSEFEEATDDE